MSRKKCNVYKRAGSPYWWGYVMIERRKYYNKYAPYYSKDEARELHLQWKKEKKEMKYYQYKTWEYCKEIFLNEKKTEFKLRT
ncbi:MAG: hypothetical protein LBF97_06895 [Elusimicrobiota bacterium]|jgi:hypothetical protein|nr:hypothetical protein [Elusimicrobiota bacterium]